MTVKYWLVASGNRTSKLNWRRRHFILLLISADFLASEYCNDVELKKALERHAAGDARVLPVILRPCDWTSQSFSRFAGPSSGGAQPRPGSTSTRRGLMSSKGFEVLSTNCSAAKRQLDLKIRLTNYLPRRTSNVHNSYMTTRLPRGSNGENCHS